MISLTVLFGDRERKSSPIEIAQRAREVVDAALAPTAIPGLRERAQGPYWLSVAMQMNCADEIDSERLLRAISSTCPRRNVSIMGVRRV